MRFLPIVFFVFILLPSLHAQQPSRADLENRRAKLLKEISETQQQLAATKKDKTATLSQLKAINAKLDARQKLINNINTEIKGIDGSIRHSAGEIERLNNNLGVLRKSYAQSIRYAYKRRESQNMMAFLFSANDFNDAIRRMAYLKRYREYRKEQADKIRVTQEKLNQQISVLNNQKQTKGKLLTAEEQQRQQIEAESKQTNEIVVELKGRENELMKDIQQNSRNAKKLEASIKEMIRKEIEIARKKAEEEARRKAAEELARKKAAEEEARRIAAVEAARKRAAEEAAAKNAAATAQKDGNTYQAGGQTVTLNTGKTNTPPPVTEPVKAKEEEPVKPMEAPSYKLSLTPEVQAVSNNFAANRGRLPWPVEKGFISGKYGRQQHPLFPKVTIENNGVDISTAEGAPVRAVFDGVVTKIANIDGVMIMVSHGEYFTIYTNLSGASVRVGDKIKTKQVIGRAGKNSEGADMVNFQIWRVGANNNIATVNPAEWIAR